MSIILLTTFLAIAQEDSAVTISAKDDGRIVAECPDCRDNIIVANGLYILHVTDFLEYHLFYPFFISARSLIISTYCRTKDLLISSSEAIFSAGIPSP